MENNEINALIAAFKEYRDLIGPIEQSLSDFSTSFSAMKEDIKSLNNAFDGSIQKKLDSICSDLNGQAQKAQDLSSKIENFSNQTSRYVSSIERLNNLLSNVESKINSINEIEQKANAQIEKLNQIIDEKSKVYDIKSLGKNLESYNENVQKISEFINKDIAEKLKQNSDNIEQILNKNNSVFEALQQEKSSIENLIVAFNNSNTVLKNVVAEKDVNEEYIFDILDRWAIDRKVKTKK